MTPDCMVKLKEALTPEEYATMDAIYAGGEGNSEQWRMQLARYYQTKKVELREDMATTVAQSDQLIKIRDRVDNDPKIAKYVLKRKDLTDQKDLFKLDNKIRARTARVLDQHLVDMISGGGARPAFKGVSLDVHTTVVRNQLAAHFVEMLEKTRPTLRSRGNLRGKDTMEKFIKAVHKAPSDLDAVEKKIVESWNKYSAEKIRRYLAAGGDPGSRMNGYTPSLSHNMVRIREVGEDAWIKNILDKDKFEILKPADAKMSDEEFARKMYRHMTSDGVAGFRPDKLGEIQNQERYIQATSGESWLEYNKNFGLHDNPMRYLENDFEQWGNKIGTYEMFGGDPRKMMEEFVQEARKITGDRNIGENALLALEYNLNTSTRDDKFSQVMQYARTYNTWAKLGMATITSANDAVTTSMRAMYNGLSPMKIFSRYLSSMASQKNTQALRAKGLILETALSRGVSTHRFLDGIASDKLGNLGHVAIKGSLMEATTNAAKTANVMEWAENIARNRNVAYGSLPKSVTDALDHYGIDAFDWAAIKDAVFTLDGTEMFNPRHQSLDPRTASKYMGMIHSEMVQAVIEPNTKSMMYTQLKTNPGGFMNEIAKTRGQFWSFPVTFLMNNWMMMTDATVSGKTRSAYLAGMVSMTTVMGMAVIQAKELAKGRSPREVDGQFVVDGFLQGGATGPLGEFFVQDPNKHGGPLAAFAGPTFSPAVDAAKYMFKAITKPEDMEFKADFAKGALDIAKDVLYVPNMWGTRLLVEQTLGNTADQLLNPNHYKDMRSYQKWLREERGQELLFPPNKQFKGFQ